MGPWSMGKGLFEWHHFAMHCGINGTTEQIRHRFAKGHNILSDLATFKGNIYTKNIHTQIVLHYTYSFYTKKYGVN
jgi:hypothetical protein